MRSKNLLLAILCFYSVLIVSCAQSEPLKIAQKMDKKSTVCYKAISDYDTAWLSIDTANKQIIGLMKFKYADKEETLSGDFIGKMYGDTLKGHFDFTKNGEKLIHRNPVAFLKKDGKFTMGVGKFMIVMGVGQFDHLVPIDFEKGRFIFEKSVCR
jgi:hypothetical protein